MVRADSNTPLGMLQRGRGAGFLRALQLPGEEAHRFIIECITDDPRLDRQVESRSEFYAELIVATEMPLGELWLHLQAEPGREASDGLQSLTVTTMGELVKRTYRDSLEILRDYIGYGEHWTMAVEDLQATGNAAALTGVADLICTRFSDDAALAEAMEWLSKDAEPWKSLVAQSPRLANAFKSGQHVSTAQKQSNAQFEAIPLGEILHHATRKNVSSLRKTIEHRARLSDLEALLEALDVEKPEATFLALCGLAKIGDERCFERVKNFVVAHRSSIPGFVRAAAGRVFTSLPGWLVLPTGREWFNRPEWELRTLGEDILEHHATQEDIQSLRNAITASMANEVEHAYRICHCLQAFRRFPGFGWIPELETAFRDCTYSYARARAAESMQVVAPRLFAERYAHECLWDCEERTRLTGIASADREKAPTKQRLQYLAEDPFIDEAVRKAAADRLK